MTLNASNFIEHIVYPDDYHHHPPKKLVNHVVLRLSSMNNSSSFNNVVEYVKRKLDLAILRGMTRVLIWDGEACAPP
ncbi:unnamed protein product [Malus baccata var. baccata]